MTMTRTKQFEHLLKKSYYESGLPDYMYEGLRNYLVEGILPGSFLHAVLTNNFTDAVFRADSTNSHMLIEWARFIYNEIPSPAWKSEASVASWCHKGGYNGIYPFALDKVTK